MYLSPIHPIIRESPVVDDDGTTREGYQELVGRLEKLEGQYSNLVFVDNLTFGFLPVVKERECAVHIRSDDWRSTEGVSSP